MRKRRTVVPEKSSSAGNRTKTEKRRNSDLAGGDRTGGEALGSLEN